MISFLNFNFWVNSFLFVLALFFAFYLPGIFFVSKLNLNKFSETVLAFLVGMVLWAWQGIVFGYLQLSWLSYVYLLIFLIFWIKKNRKNKFKLGVLQKFRKLDFVLLILILGGMLAQLSSIFFTGVLTPQGLYFCCGNIMDNILQLSITYEIAKHFPPLEPGMYPTILTNYHYWDSLVMGGLIKIFHLPLILSSYQNMTIFISLFLGLSAIAFSQILNISKSFTRWLVFFLYFGGDFVWFLIGIFRKQDFFGMNPLESGQQFLENIPRAMAIIVFFAFASIFLLWIKKRDRYTGIIMALLAASLIGFKIYVGIFVLFGLGVLGLYFLYKKNIQLLLILFLTLILSLAIYIPVNSNAGGFYYTGLWRFENFIVQPYLGALNYLENARVIYSQHNNILRIAQYELFYIFIFVLAIFGTKLIGLVQNKKSLSFIPRELHIVLIAGIILSAIIGLFFNQSTGGSNTFNFLISIFIIGSIYTALAAFYWTNKINKLLKAMLIIAIVLLTIPRGINQTVHNISDVRGGKGFLLNNKDMQAINFLAKIDTDSLVLVDPKISMDRNSPYLSFLTNKNMFLSGQYDELEAHGINFSKRLQSRSIIVGDPNASLVAMELLNNNIGYIYKKANEVPSSTASAYFLKEIFNNRQIVILKLDKMLVNEYIQRNENKH